MRRYRGAAAALMLTVGGVLAVPSILWQSAAGHGAPASDRSVRRGAVRVSLRARQELGTRLTWFEGRVRGVSRGRIVIQRRAGSHWVVIGHARLGARGRFVVSSLARGGAEAVTVRAVAYRSQHPIGRSPARHLRLGPWKGAAPPTLTASPSAGLQGGQRIRVNLAGFPPGASVWIYECAGVPAPGAATACGTAGGPPPLSIWSTDAHGRATRAFVARPTASGRVHGPTVACRSQCVLVAAAISKMCVARAQTGVRSWADIERLCPATMASTKLSFSTAMGPSLADAYLQDLSWLGSTEGWALAAQPCLAGSCARLARTTDGGRRWHALPSPPAELQNGSVDCSKAVCVSAIDFANHNIGYLYGPALLMTTDAGRSWHVQRGRQVETLTVFAGKAFRVAYRGLGCPGPCRPTLQESRVGSDRWRTLIGRLASPTSGSDRAQIVGSGSTLLVAMYGSQAAGAGSAQAILYRSGNAGASWRRQADPCSDRGHGGKAQEEDLTGLTAAPGGFFAGLCSPRSGPGRTLLITSSDAGRSWRTAGSLPAGQALDMLAAASPSNLVVSSALSSSEYGSGTLMARLLVSTDAGHRWRTAATDTQNRAASVRQTPAWLGFETSRFGSWIGDPHGVWRTHDGGRHWDRTAFP